MLGKETKNMFTNFFILSKTVESVNEGVLSCNLYKQIIISFRLSLKDLQHVPWRKQRKHGNFLNRFLVSTTI